MKKRLYKKILSLILVIIIIFSFSCAKNQNLKETLYVYNWGIYIDESVIKKFEDKYDVKVVYDTYDTNQEMYIVEKTGARNYDVLCPSDYMIEKMIKENLLYEYDLTELKNYNLIKKKILEIMTGFDYRNVYAIPYVYSTIGIIYNKTLLDKKGLSYPKSWNDLWKEEYKNEIIMQDEMRDLLLVGLKKNHFSLNTKVKSEVDKATNDLITQKPLVNSYVIDQARDKMVSGEASISVMYSGEVIYISTEGNDYEYEYIIPEEGAGFVIDAWVIPKNAKNKELAKKWIDFMLEPEIALLNYDYMHYGIANLATMDLIRERDGEDILKKDYIFPNIEDFNKYEIYRDLGDFIEYYDEAYKKIKS